MYKENDILNFNSVVIMRICTIINVQDSQKGMFLCVSLTYFMWTQNEHSIRYKIHLQNEIEKHEFMYETFIFKQFTFGPEYLTI